MKPAYLIPILAWLSSNVPYPEEHDALDAVEICAGEGQLSRALHDCGYNVKPFDVRYSGNHNILRTTGFVTILAAVRNIRKHGLLFLAPPCSTWVFLSQGSTKRNWWNPAGGDSKKVLLANVLVMRLLYLIYYAHQRGVYFVIEQPMTSVLFVWKPVQMLLEWCRARRVAFPMGAFGSPTMKMTALWGTLPNLSSLHRALTWAQLKQALQRREKKDGKTVLVKKTKSKSGQTKVAGIKSALTKSGIYPYQFGCAIAALIPNRERRAPRDFFPVGDYQGEDTLGSIDDLRKGRNHVWWKHL